MPDDDEDDDDESERRHDDDKSKSNFSYRGAGKIAAQKSVTKRAASVHSGEFSTNAKLGHRLISADSSAARPPSRRNVTPSGRRAAAPSDEGPSINVSVTRPT